MNLSLIANSGIQFHKFTIRIDPSQENIRTLGFYELLDQTNDTITLQYAYFLPDADIWVPKKILKVHDYLDENDRLKEDINYKDLKRFQLKEDKEYYTVNDITSCIQLFTSTDTENKWMPIPFFKQNSNKKNNFGPIAWARMMIKEQTDKPATRPDKYNKGREYKIILAFDTKVDDKSSIYYTPRQQDTNDEDNFFSFNDNEDLNLNFCDNDYECGWVDRAVKNIVQGGKDVDEFPRLKYLAYYLYLLKFLGRTGGFPEVSFHSDLGTAIDVDLVLDIGNSNTCGILLESPDSKKPFHFNNVKKLKLNDLSAPDKDYDESFSMFLAFAEAKFGDIDFPQHRNFRWPSLLRLGKEAGRLINNHQLDIDKGMETASSHSSPKRYLWDSQKTEVPWEFTNYSGKNLHDAIYCEGISEQFKEDGEYAFDGDFSFSPYYSRKSLMTFVFIEIILHAIAQTNSHEFRSAHGFPNRPRKLRRLTITCPTSIIQREQVILRDCAAVAVRALNRFFSSSFLGKYEEDAESPEFMEIIPKPKDLSKGLDQLDTKKDWIYDEATCGQLMFLYSEIAVRYLGNAQLFFNLFGKKRDDVTNRDKKSLTIGSIDIGGGTTDLMICAYQYTEEQKTAVLKPHPLFWESFNLAGDDFLKEVVQQVILEGDLDPETPAFQGCTGVIANEARKKGVTGVTEKMQHLFGTDSMSQGHMARIYRKNFIVQVAIPIALRYLQHTIGDEADKEIGYDELFTDSKPNPGLINWFNTQFSPLKFQDIRWKLSKSKISYIVETTFDALLKQLSAILAAYGCDFILLAGKPTTIPKIREMLIKYYPVSPERIITLTNYRSGRWYPFVDEIGYISDPKTIVSVGALVSLMGDKFKKLENFKLDTSLLRKELVSTADYIGNIDKHTQQLEEIYLDGENNIHELHIYSLPIRMGYKQLPNQSYRGKPIYKIQFNDAEIKKKVMEQDPFLADVNAIARAVESYKTMLKSNMPFHVQIQRTPSQSKENVSIVRVLDANKSERSRHLLSLNIMTLPDEYGYWLDTGEFVLNIK
ncbi:MAG: virulence factor SrfB [Bacteroidetes bacterium]|nr:virulence factor SrfB [Bacteroidota bacterium]